MATDILSTALIQSMARNLSVPQLIQTTETLKQSGQADSVGTLYASWIRYNQAHPLLYAILFNYSVALTDAGDLKSARECLEQAIALNADFMPAYINLGRIYERLGAVGPAVVQWSAVLAKLAPVNGASVTYKTTALNQSARTLETANQDEAAENLLRQSLELDCHQREVAQHFIALRQRQCEWPVMTPWERVSRDVLMAGISPLSAAAYTDDPLLHLAIAGNYNRLDVGTPAATMLAWPRAASASGPLRIGYVCSDFREHALGHLLAEVLELHDRKTVEVFAYYCGPQAQDPLHLRFKATSDHWISITEMDDLTAARRIAEDGIQILVDLNGYTREGRTKLFALRPAPVIMNWLGYPGTMGSPYHQYIIADDWIIPSDHESYYSEKVLRLPCYQPTDRRRVVSPPRLSRQDAGLPENATVFCCFNGAHKITRYMFERWLMILRLAPSSVLWLLSNTAATNERLRAVAAKGGIAPERLIFAEKMGHADHLARYRLADLFLDTTPYGAHTTASDALWMGVPVLTMSGRSFASRVCGSLVRAAGIPELVCDTADDFINRAVAFGNDRSLLEPYRQKLIAERDSCTLFDMESLVQRLEELYGEAWDEHQNSRVPRPDLTNLDVYLEIGSQVNHEELEVQTIEDYRNWWLEKLTARHLLRPIPLDGRLVADPDRFP
jgi:predicted O-linked N-acetylglucosamine transferase (SPINDLY family)